MWIRSYFRVDTIGWSNSSHFIDVVSSGGRINVTHTDWGGHTAWQAGWSVHSLPRAQARPHWETTIHNSGRRCFLGFEWTDAIWPMQDSKQIYFFYIPTYSLRAVPYWFVALLLAMPDLVRLRTALRRRARLRKNLCPNCAYDLRATPDRCPECGEVIPAYCDQPGSETVA
jgi:hypothetical protein